MTDPQRAAEVAQPKTLPVRTITSFSASLRCMDDLFLQFGRTNNFLTSQGIPDETGQVRAGTKEMLISAVSAMSVKSNAFSFVDFDQGQVDIDWLQKASAAPGSLLPADFTIPNFYIRGAVTQLDSDVISDSAGAQLRVAAVNLGASAEQAVSVVSIDLNIGNVQSRRMYPGISASNSIAVRRSGAAAEGGAQLETYGVNFNLALNKNEGVAQAVRTLVELSTIEVLGKLVQVPYWRCLQIEQTNPEIVAISRSWFESMGEKERVSFAQRALKGVGRYDGPITGTLDAATREAIGAYQAEQRLIADGRVNYDLYAALISGDLALGKSPPAEAPSVPYRPAALPVRPPIVLTASTAKAPQHRYSAGEPFTVTLRSTAEAFAYCYYRDASGSIVRIFPNQFQPDPLIEADQVVQIPTAEAGFELVPAQPGSREEVLCLATDRDVGILLPAALKAADLAPLPVGSVEELRTSFELAGKAPVASSRIILQVLP
jgi:peptidoglycan hydrolase-like protein with peptidoglycan-binding domain